MNTTPEQHNRIAGAIHDAADAFPEDENATARDWAAFFAKLIELAQVLLPILLPLFVTPPTPEPNKP